MEMDLNTIWFVLIGVLFAGFFLLEGFDYGVGMVSLLASDDDTERRMMLRTITPVWDGNEVWMLTAGGATFAAFPHVYATMFSGMYLALFLMLIGLILRGVAFEFRDKLEDLKWRRLWDVAIFIGSALPAFLWGVAVANLVSGMKIDANMIYAGTFFDLLTPGTIIGGAAFLLVFAFHGAAYLNMRLGRYALQEKIKALALKLGLLAAVFYLMFAFGMYACTGLLSTTMPLVLIGLAVVAFVAAMVLMKAGLYGGSFAGTAAAVLFTTAGIFGGLFPNILISSLNPAWSLNIYNASSTPYTLSIMTGAACVFVPIVLIYQGMAYWHFRGTITEADIEGNHY